jgi:glycosyltransferase involved in cell wall biosynthesis
VVDGLTGFQLSTVEEMFGRLEQLIHDSALRSMMGAAARKHAEKFDWDLVGKQWEEAYLKVALQC